MAKNEDDVIQFIVRGKVSGGKLIVDEPIDMPDGTEVEVTIVDDGDDLDEADRARLHEALREGLAEVERGEVIPAEDVIAELRAIRTK